MPCWEVRTVSVEFKAKHLKLIDDAATRIGLAFSFNKDGTRASVGGGSIMLNLETGVAEMEDRSRNYRVLNQLKREYSMVAIEEAARKKKWAIKRNKKSPGKLKLKKW